jgi:hypothetical protein
MEAKYLYTYRSSSPRMVLDNEGHGGVSTEFPLPLRDTVCWRLQGHLREIAIVAALLNLASRVSFQLR